MLALRIRAHGQEKLAWSSGGKDGDFNLEAMDVDACVLVCCIACVVSVENQDPNSIGSRVPPGCWMDIRGLGGEVTP
ncbi:hypothetical protein ACLOJK_014646 [Asimina triloba]